MANQYTMNANGLTWNKWLDAATVGVRASVSVVTVKELKAAWKADECPCDYAAMMAEGAR